MSLCLHMSLSPQRSWTHGSVPPTTGLIPETKNAEHSANVCPVNSVREKHKATCLTSKSDYKGVQLSNFKLLQDLGWNMSFHKLCAKLRRGFRANGFQMGQMLQRREGHPPPTTCDLAPSPSPIIGEVLVQ